MPPQNKRKRRKGPQPLAPPPTQTMSRKRARQVTTAFHKLTRRLPLGKHRNRTTDGANGDIITPADDNAGADTAVDLEAARIEYQKASQVSTSFHSTSKWVLGHLARNGWLYGIPVAPPANHHPANGSTATTTTTTTTNHNNNNNHRHHDNPNERKVAIPTKRPRRRPTRLLEIGAINTQLLEAAQRRAQYQLHVHAIDLHSMDRRIHEADFLRMKQPRDGGYDVIVCSMVINCVPTPTERGEMMCRLYHFLRPGGLLFFTLPRACLQHSPYTDVDDWQELLLALGLPVQATKTSPKIAFYICQREAVRPWDGKRWTTLTSRRQSAKTSYTGSDFSIVLSAAGFAGDTLQPTST